MTTTTKRTRRPRKARRERKGKTEKKNDGAGGIGVLALTRTLAEEIDENVTKGVTVVIMRSLMDTDGGKVDNPVGRMIVVMILPLAVIVDIKTDAAIIVAVGVSPNLVVEDTIMINKGNLNSLALRKQEGW